MKDGAVESSGKGCDLPEKKIHSHQYSASIRTAVVAPGSFLCQTVKYSSCKLNGIYPTTELIWGLWQLIHGLYSFPHLWYVTRKDIATVPPWEACWSVLNKSWQMYPVTRRGPIGNWSCLNWQPKELWSQAGLEQPNSGPKATSFILEKTEPWCRAWAAFRAAIPPYMRTCFQTCVGLLLSPRGPYWPGIILVGFWTDLLQVFLFARKMLTARSVCNLAACRLPSHLVPANLCKLLSHSMPLHARTASSS